MVNFLVIWLHFRSPNIDDLKNFGYISCQISVDRIEHVWIISVYDRATAEFPKPL